MTIYTVTAERNTHHAVQIYNLLEFLGRLAPSAPTLMMEKQHKVSSVQTTIMYRSMFLEINEILTDNQQFPYDKRLYHPG